VQDQITARLTELREDFQKGQTQLAELELQQARLRETLLRIAGAIQVLEEMLPPEAADEDPAAAPRVADAE
jgi:predicted nuclease with TOPRIM domain